jgi:glutamate--cysteine ligase catalytic subunit
MTNAQYFREFILKHPDYKQNSIITESINYDLLKHVLKIQNKEVIPEKLYGKFVKFNKN